MMLYTPYKFKSKDKYVILSSNNNPDYYFLLPIVVKAWVEKINYTPVIPLVWDVSKLYKESINSLVLDYCCAFGAYVVVIDSGIIGNDPRFNGYNHSMLAQISRFCCSSLMPSSSSEDYFLTSDADMIPANKDFFHQQDFSKDIHLFYANGYHHKRYPVCYIGMNVAKWEELMDLEGLDIYSALSKLTIFDLQRNSRKDVQWGYDEHLFFKKIKMDSFYPNNCHMIDRRVYVNPKYTGQPNTPRLLPYGRLDRSNWDLMSTLNCKEGLIDIHCMRMPFMKDNWFKIMDILNFIFNGDTEDFKRYKKEFDTYV